MAVAAHSRGGAESRSCVVTEATGRAVAGVSAPPAPAALPGLSTLAEGWVHFGDRDTEFWSRESEPCTSVGPLWPPRVLSGHTTHLGPSGQQVLAQPPPAPHPRPR